MIHNVYWRSFLIILLCILCIYTLQSCWIYFRWSQIDDRAMAKTIKWYPAKLFSGKYTLRGKYTFDHEGKEYSGETTFSAAYFLNKENALEHVEKANAMEKQYILVLFANYNPEINTLEYFFPMRRIVYTVMLTIAWLYLFFVSLGSKKTPIKRA